MILLLGFILHTNKVAHLTEMCHFAILFGLSDFSVKDITHLQGGFYSTGGEEGIRTLVGLPPNGFQDRLVMTTSILLRISRRAVKLPSNVYLNIISHFIANVKSYKKNISCCLQNQIFEKKVKKVLDKCGAV